MGSFSRWAPSVSAVGGVFSLSCLINFAHRTVSGFVPGGRTVSGIAYLSHISRKHFRFPKTRDCPPSTFALCRTHVVADSSTTPPLLVGLASVYLDLYIWDETFGFEHLRSHWARVLRCRCFSETAHDSGLLTIGGRSRVDSTCVNGSFVLSPVAFIFPSQSLFTDETRFPDHSFLSKVNPCPPITNENMRVSLRTPLRVIAEIVLQICPKHRCAT